MSEAADDPYAVLGVAPDVSDSELRRAYRLLVKRHHPDHNANSPESARRFAQVQSAYAVISQRRGEPRPQPPRPQPPRPQPPRPQPPRPQQPPPQGQHRGPTPEDLGYYTTDDSFTTIIDDAIEQVGQRLRGSDAKRRFSQRLSDLFGGED